MRITIHSGTQFHSSVLVALKLRVPGKFLPVNNCFSYIHGSVHRNSRLKKSNEMQQYADIYLLLNYSTCFGRPSRPSLGVYKTVVAGPGTDHSVWGASFPDSMICTRGCNYSFMYC